MSEAKKAVEVAAKAAPAKDTKVIYVGPTIKGVAIYGTVYSAIPPQAREARNDAPQFLNLFVPVIDYGKADKMITDRKGYVYEAYKEAWEKLRARKEA